MLKEEGFGIGCVLSSKNGVFDIVIIALLRYLSDLEPVILHEKLISDNAHLLHWNYFGCDGFGENVGV